ncbi:MAG: hypothetical protein JJ895_00675 [Balneolaceae bacterium]|nr:hypothetical protein [Balneolaceae bacterium]
MNISLVVRFSGLTLVAQFGYASVLTYMLLILSLFIPIWLIVSELNARMSG